LEDSSVIEGFLPTIVTDSELGHTLITTRNPYTFGIPAEGLEVNVLDQDEAVELLLLLSETASSATSKNAAREIVEELEYLPLAIEVAAGYIRESSRSIDTFLAIYQENVQDIHQWLPDGNRNYEHTLATVWEMSFNIIKKDTDCPEAFQLLQLFAFLNPDVILVDFLVAGSETLNSELSNLLSNAVRLDRSLALLRRFSLIKRLRDVNGVSIHRLVQETIQNKMTGEERINNWEMFAKMCLGAFPTETTAETRSTCRVYQDQVLVPLLKIPELKSETLRICLESVGSFLTEDGKYHPATILFKKSYNVSVDLWGFEGDRTLTLMRNLALTYHMQGQWDEAVKLHKTALEDHKMVLGERHPDTLTVMNNLASSYRNQGRWKEAAKLEETVLEARKAVLGDWHPKTLLVMGNLALTYLSLGKWDAAAQLLLSALEGSMAVLGDRHPSTLTLLNNLATTYMHQGRWDKAAKLQEMVLDVRKAVLGDQHPDTLSVMVNLATTYQKLGQWDEAVKLKERVIEDSKAVLGDQHPDTVTGMGSLATIYWDQGQLDKAVTLQKTVLEDSKAVFGDQHPHTLIHMSNLALTYWSQERWDEAAELQEMVLAGTTVVFGDQHPYTLTAMILNE
jgi:tetratricopeptide (TPR) repeat protein